MTGCSYPYSYVEPYPEFYSRLGTFANNAAHFLSQLDIDSWEFNQIPAFFNNFSSTMQKLELLAEKELNNQAFSIEEEDWLRRMLFRTGESGAPPYSGWYGELYLNGEEMTKPDYITVDIHTQPTDEVGALVGKVLHAGLGKINLGVFMVPQPGTKNNYIAYTGPFYSYYEEITNNFHRMTDHEWEAKVENNQLPARPEWTASYLLNDEGGLLKEAMVLPSVYLIGKVGFDQASEAKLFEVYPIPASNYITINTSLPGKEDLAYTLTGVTGRVFLKGKIQSTSALVDVSMLNKGVYLLRVESDGKSKVFRMMKE